MNPETLRDFFRERSWTIQMPYDNAQPDDPFPLVVDAVKHAVLADAIQRVEGLPTLHIGYDGETADPVYCVRLPDVLAILRDLGDGAG